MDIEQNQDFPFNDNPLGDRLSEEDTIESSFNIGFDNDDAASKYKPEDYRRIYTQLQERDTTYVFVFGRESSGKSAMVSGLTHYMATTPFGELTPNSTRKQNEQGVRFYNDLRRNINVGKFIDRTPTLNKKTITELDLSFTPENRKKMNLTFLEMSGEDLKKVEIETSSSEPYSGILPDEINFYLECPEINLLFILVTSHDTNEDDDQLLARFIEYIRELSDNHENPDILLAITKWDTYKDAHKQNVLGYVNEHLKSTYQKLNSINQGADVVWFSLGDMQIDKTDNSVIAVKELKLESSETVVTWLYEKIAKEKLFKFKLFRTIFRFFK
ncbi:MAG: hypothetical protein ED557_00160 [Balneola sp.]|nr:MAG: hypothetical protein ED557_00160 [Balneola sp.]